MIRRKLACCGATNAGLLLAALAPAFAWPQPLLTIARVGPAGIRVDGTLAPDE